MLRRLPPASRRIGFQQDGRGVLLVALSGVAAGSGPDGGKAATWADGGAGDGNRTRVTSLEGASDEDGPGSGVATTAEG